MSGIVAVYGVLFALPLAVAGQPSTRPAAAAEKACSLLTKELVTQVTPYERDALSLAFSVPAQADPVGPAGSACEYGGVHLQVDPFGSPEGVERDLLKGWVREPAVGDIAFFRDNRGEWAELYVRSRGRVVTVQMDIPNGKTAAAIKPNTIALAKAVLDKLR